ncbi:hypothetical protein IW140_005261 [Coemansia sp. RSA 1813]|nr:hypothetical protein EV178_004273 [Coemansia sp. RSA 1646]KAJ1770844.1 hypothetical protein LPJ74_002830 [Coemansia sp. RSA 1843]KAJ2087106.1 hypothetical protein IW138_005204 [Coemansia sp. RSA 986]KAJ2211739.1 hypothetical protein EV179_005240 [Coemansia sp. RSA 487]KAJ2565625.1 hypothetical protein IW140_005261 [Coemansia sp. RSA 1813]
MFNAYNNNNGGYDHYDHYNQHQPQQAAFYNRPPSDHYNNGFTVSPATSDGLDSGQFFSARADPHASHDSLGGRAHGFGDGQQRSSSAAGFYLNRHPESDATAYDTAEAELLKNEDELKSPAKRRKRRCCGGGYYCFCFSRKCCLIFIPILILILAGLGVTLYYVFPRIPQVTFDHVSVPQSGREATSGATVQQLVDGVSINRDGVVTVPLVIHLNVTNPNFIPWTIHNVTVDGFLKNSTSGGSNFPVGSGGLQEPFKMPKKSEGNDMGISFNFRLDTSNNNYLQAAEVVQQACTAGGPQLRFYYSAKVILKAISWLGIKPTISDTINFDCPISQIESLGINISDLTGLTST